ncbi:unnamed protein product, partial [Meganyctiphanes norvegica]
MEASPLVPCCIDILKGQNITVTVQEALPDIILVNLNHGNKLFQGVLLDSTKGNIPCGIYPPGEFPPRQDDDKLAALKQRHTYFQPEAGNQENKPDKKDLPVKRKITLTQKFKNSRMTVRLRPRQVLCSKCQAICNDKSENVSGAKGQKPTEAPTTVIPPTPVTSTPVTSTPVTSTPVTSTPVTSTPKTNETQKRCVRPSREARMAEKADKLAARLKNNKEKQSEKEKEKEKEKDSDAQSTLVPRLVKLKPSEIETATSKGVSCLQGSPVKKIKNTDSDSCDSEVSVGANSNCSSESKRSLKLKISKSSGDNSSNLKKGSVPKVTISMKGENSSQENCSEKSSSKIPSIPKMILSTSEKLAKSKKLLEESENKVNIKDLRPRSNNKLQASASVKVESEENSGERVSPIPRLTILPLAPKKEIKVEKHDSVDPSHKYHKPIKSASLDESPTEKMNLRKKRSLGSMEDLWDENILNDETTKKKKVKGEVDKPLENPKLEVKEKEKDYDKPKATPRIKISFGGDGKGTILKIPSKSTVVSIPSDPPATEQESLGEVQKKYKDISAKAAKKALRKAKKEAARRSLTGGGSPAYILGGMSPRLSGMSPSRLGGISPARFGGTSPARSFGVSPARANPVDIHARELPPKKHKHKVKHKKKHKEDRKHKFQEIISINGNPVAESQEDSIKEHSSESKSHCDSLVAKDNNENETPQECWDNKECKTHINEERSISPIDLSTSSSQHPHPKLSLSIKRVSNASYVALDPSASVNNSAQGTTEASEDQDTRHIDSAIGTLTNCDSKKAPICLKEKVSSSKSSSTLSQGATVTVAAVSELVDYSQGGNESPGSDDNHSGAIPDFPCSEPSIAQAMKDKSSGALLMKLQISEVQQCNINDGQKLAVGDVVWGKIHGFPWWPAKVVCMRILRENSGEVKWQQADISWYGSSTSSIMPAESLQPFLKNFKLRYNKKKRGPYREAIKQATAEAKLTAGQDDQEHLAVLQQLQPQQKQSQEPQQKQSQEPQQKQSQEQHNVVDTAPSVQDKKIIKHKTVPQLPKLKPIKSTVPQSIRSSDAQDLSLSQAQVLSSSPTQPTSSVKLSSSHQLSHVPSPAFKTQKINLPPRAHQDLSLSQARVLSSSPTQPTSPVKLLSSQQLSHVPSPAFKTQKINLPPRAHQSNKSNIQPLHTIPESQKVEFAQSRKSKSSEGPIKKRIPSLQRLPQTYLSSLEHESKEINYEKLNFGTFPPTQFVNLDQEVRDIEEVSSSSRTVLDSHTILNPHTILNQHLLPSSLQLHNMITSQALQHYHNHISQQLQHFDALQTNPLDTLQPLEPLQSFDAPEPLPSPEHLQCLEPLQPLAYDSPISSFETPHPHLQLNLQPQQFYVATHHPSAAMSPAAQQQQ